MLLNHLLNTKISGKIVVPFSGLSMTFTQAHQIDAEKNTVKAILNRVEIRKSFLLSLVYLSKLEGSYLTTAKSELNKILELLATVDLTIGNEVADAFDPNINRKLTSQTPPRPVELSSVEESFKEYTLLIQRLRSICDVIDYPSVNSLMNYFLDFAAHQPYPDAFSRSKLNVSMKKSTRQNILIPSVRTVDILPQPTHLWHYCRLQIHLGFHQGNCTTSTLVDFAN